MMNVSCFNSVLRSYTFNLRDYSRVIQGILMSDMSKIEDQNGMVRLWLHEALRVFADRLTDEGDRDWFVSQARIVIEANFGLGFDEALNCVMGSAETVGYGELRKLFFANFMVPREEEVRPYTEITNMEQLQETVKQYLADFNAQSRKPMDLVMFR